MTLVRIIQIDAEPELLCYHEGAQGLTQPFAVAISPAAEGDDEAGAKEHFQTVLNGTSAIDWYSYRLEPGISPKKAIRVQTANVPIINSNPSKPDSALQKHLMGWLDKRKAIQGQSFYISKEPDKEIIEASAASAGDTLRLALSWDAPIPQNLGLIHLVKVPNETPGIQFLVPILPGGAAPNELSVERINGDQVRLKGDLLGNGSSVICQTNALRAPPSKEAIKPVDQDTGFLIANKDTPTLRRSLQMFEEVGPSLFWTTPALQELISNDKKDLNALSDPTLKTVLSTKQVLMWLAAIGTATALDSVLMALKMPDLDASEGYLLAPLIDIALAAITHENKEHQGADLRRLNDDHLRAAFKAAIATTPLFASKDDKKVITELQRLHELPTVRKPGAATPDLDYLNSLLFDFQAYEIGDEIDDKNINFASLTRALGDLIATLEEEEGIERVILAIIKPLFFSSGKDSFLSKIEEELKKEHKEIKDWHLGEPQKKLLAKAIKAAWLSYHKKLNEGFDGAEAVRRSVGHVLHAALLTDTPKPLKIAKVASLLNNQHYFSTRVLPVSSTSKASGLKKLAECLWRPSNVNQKWLTKVQVADLTIALDDFFKTMTDTLIPVSKNKNPEALRLMIPDQSPGPLSIQIADDLSPETLEEFDESFKGIGVLVQRRFHSEDNKNTHWAHANLVALLNGETKESITDVTLRPFFPALIDNRRALFLDYHGFPLATPAFDDTRVPQDITSDSELGMSRSFYLAADIDSKTEFGGLPKLAYGAEFRTAAFAVTNSGTLPPLVRDPNKPHRPNKPGNISDDFVGSEVYQRRTAIGKITLSVPDEYKKAAAIVAKVQPLSADYPRQSLGCSINNIATLDIFRNVDGQGAINLGTGEAAAITLRNLEWQGDKASLIIEVMHMTLQGNLHAHPVAIKYRPGSDGKLTNTDFCTAYGLEMTITQKVLSLKRKTLNRKVTEEKTHHTFASELSPGPYWLRLTLKPNDSEASISFDDTLTSADPGNYYARPEAASRILMTKDEDTWAKPLRGKKILVIDFPRVGYIDFERWHANPNLPKANGLSDKVEDILMIAYLMRGSIDQNALSKNESSIAELLERLPDPAVHKLLVTLIPEDDLLEDTQRDGKKATAVSIILDIPAIPSPEFDTNTDNPDEYRKYLSGINTDLRAKINVSVGSEFIIDSSGDEIQISLMEGMVARLQVRPLIKASTVFPKSTYAAFDEGIVARALSKTVIVTKEKDDASTETDCIIFPGPDMVIETLADSLSVENQKDELRQLIPEMILCDPSGLDRAYALRLSQELPKDKKKSNIWRSLSHVEIVTQQWRFSGRPIYNWPTLPQYIKGASPVVELTTQNTKGILDFEKEAFFDRDNADSAHLTKRIEPLAPNGTTSTKTVGGELQRFSWSAPTATMFRHRFIMHSRYAAAMVKGVREVISWSTENNQSQSDTKNSSKIQAQKGSSTTWTYRVAVRASLSRIEVTRPQLRALLPLTAPAGHFEKMNAHPCPPLLAVLEEKPSVDGGLADRVLGMIHTGVHFGFPERPKDTDDLKEWTVQPLDIRKEIGPNPRMALHPLDVKAGLSTVLSHEGPIGLTFDVDTATNPAWANSQHLFTPKRIGKESNELSKEMHMGVSLMRILDPSWCDAPIEEDHSNLDIRRNWLIKFKTIPTNAEVVVGIGDKTLLKACENNRTLKIWNKTLDTDTKTNDWFDLCLLDDSHDHAISLLHQSLGEGRFRATLLHTQQRKNTDAGELITLGCDSTFNVLASILWSMPGLDADKSLPAHTLTPHFVDSVLPVASSAPTDVRWVKTIGDNTMVSVARLDNTVRKTELVPHDAIKVELLPHDVIEAEQEKPKVLSFTINNKQLWLKGEVAAQNVPNATHRHMAAIFTEYLSGPGRPLEIYTGSMLMIGRDLKLENDKVLTAIKNEKGRVRLLSFETPARPVMANAQKEKSIRQEYKQAYFDRKAVISESSPEEIRLRICFVRSDPKSKPISEIKFNYSVSDGSYIEQATKIEIGETATTTLFLDTIELVLTLQSDEIIYKTSAVNIFSDGSQKKFDDLGVAFNAPLNDGFAIAINAYNTNKSEVKELWADISCLFSEKKPQYNEFNFDWILSPNAHDQDVVEQTQPKALNKMTEAQGLVQMISPSIRVFSPKS